MVLFFVCLVGCFAVVVFLCYNTHKLLSSLCVFYFILFIWPDYLRQHADAYYFLRTRSMLIFTLTVIHVSMN